MPCYNHGKYIMDAINSVEKITDKSLYELIIINDGSTDEYTNQKLREIADLGYNVIFQENKGLSTTRNLAIAQSRGEYILPVDSDNMIRPEYVYEAIKILDENKDVSIVYADAEFFGEWTGRKRHYEFNLQRLMLHNSIDACAFYRRTVWEATGGYDKNMRFGLEDWEMWLHAAFKGFKFHFIDKVLFDYRVLNTSMVNKLNDNKIKNDYSLDYMSAKHPYFFGPDEVDRFMMSKFDKNPGAFILKLLIKKYFPKKFNKMVSQGKLRKHI